MTEIPGPQGGPLGGGGPEIPGGFSQGPFYGPPEWVSYNVPPQLRLGMTDVQQNGTSRGGVPLYQGTDQYGREWQWSARGPIGYRDDEDGIWHEVSEQDGIWHDRWTDQNGWARHSTQDAQGNHLSTTSSHPEIPLSPPDAFTDAIKDDVFAAPPPPPFVEAPPDAFKDNVFAEPPPYQEPPPEDFKDNVFADPPPPDGDIQVRLPDAFKDNAVEPPPSWSYGDIQVRPPEDFIDKAVEPPPYQEPPPEEPPVAEPPPGAEGGEEEEQLPPVTQTPEAEPPVQPTPRGDDGGGIPGLGVPYQDFIPSIPMVQDPTTGEWRNAEPGEIPGAEGGEADPNAPLQFGNTSNFQNVPEPNAPLEDRSQEVPPLQFGNTGNLQPSQEFEEAILFEEDLFNPEAPGPTLSTDLFDPTAPGPTLDTGLIPELEHSPQVVEALNQDPDLAATLARDPGMIEHLKQDASLSYGERTGIVQGDGGRTDQGFTDPSLTEQEDTPDHGFDYTL